MEHDHIRKFWESQGEKYGASHWSSWGDSHMIELEVLEIGKHITKGDKIIDIGCASGFSSFEQLEREQPSHVTGIDFCDSMIDAANLEKAKRELSNIDFETGDVRDLRFADGEFDMAYTTRVIINLATWEEQKAAIDECLRVVRPGGKLVLSEAFYEPQQLLNSLRTIKNLPPLMEHDFNRYIKKCYVTPFLEGKGLEYEIVDFSSIYYLGSRFLRELVTDVSQYEGFSNPINEIFFGIEKNFSGGGFGVQQAIVINKP